VDALPLEATTQRRPLAPALLWGYATLMYVFLYGPIVVLGVFSVNDSAVVAFPLSGFTLRWYRTALTTPVLLAALRESLLLGVASAAISTSAALLLALGFRRGFRGQALVFNLILVPLIIPGIVSGIVLLVLFGVLGVDLSIWRTVLPAHVTYTLPFAFLTLYARVHGLDPALEEAAMDLGARRWETFRRVTFPLIRPGLVASGLFAFSLSFDEFIRTYFLVGTGRTLPVHVWTMLFETLSPEVTALAVLTVLISVSCSVTGFVLVRR
jgi:ABC-type spermidine/putrescine transport system permease subunit II